MKGRAWSARRVMDFRLSNGIPSGFTVSPQFRLTENGYLTSAEAAARLEINQTTVQKWYKLGLLPGKHAGGQKALWIAWTEEVEQCLGGQASFDPRMASVKSLCKLQGKHLGTGDPVVCGGKATRSIVYAEGPRFVSTFYQLLVHFSPSGERYLVCWTP